MTAMASSMINPSVSMADQIARWSQMSLEVLGSVVFGWAILNSVIIA